MGIKRALFLRGKIQGSSRYFQLKEGQSDPSFFEDMWCEFFHTFLMKMGWKGETLCHLDDESSLSWIVDDSYTEHWVNIEGTTSFQIEEPNLTFVRGERPYYHPFLFKFPRAKRVYYGAGRRCDPDMIGNFYDVGFVDSPLQLADLALKVPFPVRLFMKPCATLFKKIPSRKVYDVLFVAANPEAKRKRIRLFLESMQGSGLKILYVGSPSPKIRNLSKKFGLDVTFAGFHRTPRIPELAKTCRACVNTSDGDDSAPQSVIEAIAMGLPVIVTKSLNIWTDRYINSRTGIVVPDDQVLSGTKYVLTRLGSFSPGEYYDENLSMDACVDRFIKLLDELEFL